MKKKIKILIVVGARPNFIKIAPLYWEFGKHPKIKPVLVHTGQHYDYVMSRIFFKDLNIPKPDYNLGIGSGNHGSQTGLALIEMEKVMMKEKPGFIIVVGDVNSTLAGALAAAKLHIPVAHIEAGLRSFDKSMPEEINRLLTDHVSDLLFCPTRNAVANLKKEGIMRGVFNTGDIMLDILKIKLKDRKSAVLENLNVKPKDYLLLTIHRAGNVDNPDNLRKIIGAVAKIKEKIIFPVHPRTRLQIKNNKLAPLIEKSETVEMIEPVSYLEMLALEKNAKKILTDSGGVQKEAFWLGVPCVTLRDETEWVETVRGGWNILTGVDEGKILRAVKLPFPGGRPAKYYGSGTAAKKMTAIIAAKIGKK